MLGLLRDLLTALPENARDDRQLHDSGLIGDYNHRTGRLDAGNDPYGWSRAAPLDTWTARARSTG